MPKIRKDKTICFFSILILAISLALPLSAQGASLVVQVSANPSSGSLPLNDVDFSFGISGTATGDIVYKIDCTSDSIFEKIETTTDNSFVEQDICDYPNVGIYAAKIEVLRESLHYQTTLPIIVSESPVPPGPGPGGCPEVSVDIKARGTDGPITIPYNDSVQLTWTSNNATSCSASDDWPGFKLTLGSEETGNLISSKIYTLTCSNLCSSGSDKVEVNVTPASSPVLPILEVEKLARNLSKGSAFLDSVQAEPAELISFQIKVTAEGASVDKVIVKDILPEKIIYQGNLKINGTFSTGDITSGLDLGNLPSGLTKTITFDVKLAESNEFGFGQTKLANTVSVAGIGVSNVAAAEIIVSKKEVAGATTGLPTEISTGWTNNIFLDTFFLPLLFALVLTWLLKSHIISFEEWLNNRKTAYQEYQSGKSFKELLKKKIRIH